MTPGGRAAAARIGIAPRGNGAIRFQGRKGQLCPYDLGITAIGGCDAATIGGRTPGVNGSVSFQGRKGSLGREYLGIPAVGGRAGRAAVRGRQRQQDTTISLAAVDTAVKVDVEGYEYELLSHVLLTRPQSLCELDLLAVEWHEGTRLPMHRGHRAHLEWMLDQRPCRVQVVPYV